MRVCLSRYAQGKNAGMTDYDAVVVGAGPAGTSAAWALARGGARVLMLEKAVLPRYKPCGGGLTGRSRAALPHITAFAPESSAHIVRVAHHERTLAPTLPVPVTMVMRDRFDLFLAEQAVAAGAELRDGTALESLEIVNGGVRVQASAETIAARYLVGADGANGITARLAGLGPLGDHAAAVEVEMAVPDAARTRYDDTALVDFGAIEGGYGWIFGKSDRLSVGVGSFLPGSRRDLRAILDRFLATHPDLQGGTVLLRRGHRIPLAGKRGTRHNGPVVLAGDAATVADPITAEGIAYALLSGRRAGETVLSALAATPAALDDYDRWVDRELWGELRYARMVARIVYRYPGVFLGLIAQHPRLEQVAASAVAGTLSYKTLFKGVVKRAPQLVRYGLHNPATLA